jgi:hypothetical protein
MIDKYVRCLLAVSPPHIFQVLPARFMRSSAFIYSNSTIHSLKPVILENSSGAYIFIKIHIYSTQSTQQARKKQDFGGGNRSKLKSAKKRKTTVLRQLCLCQRIFVLRRHKQVYPPASHRSAVDSTESYGAQSRNRPLHTG